MSTSDTPLDRLLPVDLETARERIAQTLQAEGFGILTEIDVQATFQAKLGVEHEPHRILGVCNPQFAKRALDADRDVALLLPCTVTLRAVDGGTEVRVLDPERVFRLAEPATQTALEPLAAEVRTRLVAALAAAAAA
jgi:uncharacterized protein (DUF302 family)